VCPPPADRPQPRANAGLATPFSTAAAAGKPAETGYP
jgi:hypothetical protein